jgi:hypothetical protein
MPGECPQLYLKPNSKISLPKSPSRGERTLAASSQDIPAEA